MSTETKIKYLGELYKQLLECRDEQAVCESIHGWSEREELLKFAILIGYQADKPMQRIITGLRGLLENAVHTESGN